MKKIFAILIIAIFLITSLGIISATEDSNLISVNAVGDDLPNQIKVSLLCDDKVVDTATLSSANSWNATFKVDGDGDYKIKTEEISDYSLSVKGDASKGFVITSKLLNRDVLGAAEDDDSNDGLSMANNASGEDDSSSDDLMAATNNTSNNLPLEATNNTSNNGTVAATGNSSSNNGTNSSGNSTDDNATSKKTVTKKKVTKKTVTKKVKQKPVKKPKKETKKYKTGLPFVVLVVAAMVAIFVPFARKK
jgi:hypothetical protein